MTKNIMDDINKWVNSVGQSANDLTKQLYAKYKDCTDRIASITKKEEEKKSDKVIHLNISCDGCKVKSIEGIRFKCAICDNYNLCEKCEEKLNESHAHPFIKIYYPNLAPINFKCFLNKNM